MDRAPYLLPFFKDRIPNWSCPRCKKSHLALSNKEILQSETNDSHQAREHEDWEPDWVSYVFSCIFKCSDPNCKESISCNGFGYEEHVDYYDENYGWAITTETSFSPKFFLPHLILMDIPKNCPQSVITHLHHSFNLFFSDPGAALNSARAAVEAMLTDLKIRRYSISKGKRRPISLHQRIQSLPAKYKEFIDLLLAVKWLGNAGSHDGEIPTPADARLVYDLLEHVLSEVYEDKTLKLKALAKKVNKKKGPVK